MSIQRWLARTKPRGAETLRLFVQGEAHTSFAKDATEIADYAAFAKSVTDLGEEIADEQGVQVSLRVAWFDRREKELPAGYSWTIGHAQGQAPTDGTSNASAINAQRHLEAIMRLMVAQQQTHAKQTNTLVDGYRSLADTARARAIDSDSESRMLRAELRAWRERADDAPDVDDDGPGLDAVLDKLGPDARDQVAPLVMGALAKIVDAVTRPAASGGSDRASGDDSTANAANVSTGDSSAA